MKAEEAKRLKELGGGEQAAEEAAGRGGTGQGDSQGGPRGKLLSPARRRAAVEHVQRQLGVSRASGVQGAWSVSIEPAVRAAGGRGGEAAWSREMLELVRQHPRYGYRMDLGVAATGGLAGEPQADLSTVASGRAESAAKTAEKAAFGAQRQQLRPSQGGAQGPRMDVGLHPRSDDQRPAAEVAVDRGRVHARMPGVGGGSQHHGREA